jgi:hypothetical protein
MIFERPQERPDRPTQFSMRPEGAPTSAVRRYEVCGVDEEGNVHSFHTDNYDQARDIADILSDDLSDVRILENG